MGFLPCLAASTTKKITYGKMKDPLDSIADYNEVDEDLPSVDPNFNDEELGYVDFFGVDNLLSDSHNNDRDEFYADEKNYKFTREIMTNSFLSIFMACGREKARGKREKPKVWQGEPSK
jgi:hypothetical protein